MVRDNLTESEALQRINAQMPLSEKCRKAYFIVDNSNGKDLTRAHTYTLFATMQRLSYHQKMLRRLFLVVVALVFVYIVFNLLLSYL
jgi:dephospho-CoA kinase